MDFLESVNFTAVIELPYFLVSVDWLGTLRLPGKIRCYGTLGTGQGVGQCRRASEYAVVVIAHPGACGGDQHQRNGGATKQYRCSWPILSKEHPPHQKANSGNAKKHAFVQAGGEEKYEAGRHEETIDGPRLLHESWKCSEQERSAESGDRSGT